MGTPCWVLTLCFVICRRLVRGRLRLGRLLVIRLRLTIRERFEGGGVWDVVCCG